MNIECVKNDGSMGIWCCAYLFEGGWKNMGRGGKGGKGGGAPLQRLVASAPPALPTAAGCHHSGCFRLPLYPWLASRAYAHQSGVLQCAGNARGDHVSKKERERGGEHSVHVACDPETMGQGRAVCANKGSAGWGRM